MVHQKSALEKLNANSQYATCPRAEILENISNDRNSLLQYFSQNFDSDSKDVFDLCFESLNRSEVDLNKALKPKDLMNFLVGDIETGIWKFIIYPFLIIPIQVYSGQTHISLPQL